METSRRKALGRGLEELFNNEPMDYEKIEEKIMDESTNEEIVELINQHKFDLNKVDEFCKKFFVEKDGNSSKRFVYDVLLKIKNKEI